MRLLKMATVAIVLGFSSLSAKAQTVPVSPHILTTELVNQMPERGGALGLLYSQDSIPVDGKLVPAFIVDDVTKNSALSASGVKPGTIILAINGKVAPDAAILARYVRTLRPGEPVNLTIVNGVGQQSSQTVQINAIARDTMEFSGIDKPKKDNNAFARGCVGGGVAAGLTVLIPGILTSLFDGGLLFFASLPKAFAAGAVGCVAVGAGQAIAQEVTNAPAMRLYQRML